jgi:hypothetical protein
MRCVPQPHISKYRGGASCSCSTCRTMLIGRVAGFECSSKRFPGMHTNSDDNIIAPIIDRQAY